MRKRDFIRAGTVGSLALGAASAANAQSGPTYNWKMATIWPGGPMMEIGAKAFADRMALLSGGRFKIQVFPGGALGNTLRVPDTVKNGVAECGHTWIGADWGKDQGTVLFGGYAGSFDTERMLHWLYQGGGVELQRKFRDEGDGIISMPLAIRTAEVFVHSRKPVKTLADLKGLKIRTAGAWLEMAKDLGASPLTTAGGDIYPMLERGAIDAVEWGTMWENISMGFHKVAKYLVYPGVHQPTAPFELVINKDVWMKMPEADRNLIEIVSRQITLDCWMRVGYEDVKAFDFFKAQGVEMIELDDEVQFAARKLGLEWADRTAKSGKFKMFAEVHQSQVDFDKAWRNADSWRKVKVKPV